MDDTELLRRFEAQDLAPPTWNHAAHLRMAWIYLERLPVGDALDRLRSGIQRLNAVNAVPEALLMGYHETVTEAWLRIVDCTRRVQGAGANSREFLEAQSHLCQRTLLRLYYSRERMCSAEAKARFVDPDLAPLPRPPAA